MSTIYSWAAEHGADTTGAAADYTLVYDTSAGRTKKASLASVFLGQDASKVVGFYGETGVNQGTMTAAAVSTFAASSTGLADATTAGVWAWSSSTVAKAYVKRLSQIQVDLEALMNRFNSTGLINVTGLS